MTAPTSGSVFPNLAPSKRTHTPAEYPVQTFKSEAGVEVRILYGNQPTGATLSLQYKNLSDAEAELFVEHFRSVKGTFQTFSLGSVAVNPGTAVDEDSAKAGWSGNPANLSKDSGSFTGNQWRYAKAPQLQSIKRGISSVTVDLIAVL